MKIITWNCNMAFRKKYSEILSNEPDLLIIPECEHPENFNDTFYSDVVWIGNNNKKGLGIFCFNGFKASLHKSYCEDFKYILPIEVSRNNEKIMNLIAIWAQDNTENPKRRYIENVWCALNYYKELLETPIIIAGDFNWNVIWDIANPSLYGTLTDVIDLLEQYNIYSTYHSLPDEIFGMSTTFGNEKDPTLFLLKNKEKRYHIDYIFTSQDLINKLESCSIGKYKDWIKFSDHMPVTAVFKDTKLSRSV